MKAIKIILIMFIVMFDGFIYAQHPDLIVNLGSFTPETIGRGEILTTTAIIQNTGTSNSSMCRLIFYLSATNKITDGVPIGCTSVEPLNAGSISETKQIMIPLPASLDPGSYYVGWEIDPYNEVLESDENNVFHLSSVQLTVTNNLIFSRHLPYPLIFIHGLISSDQTWNSFLSNLDLYGWSFGGRMDFCLNYDDKSSTSLLTNDIHDFSFLSP